MINNMQELQEMVRNGIRDFSTYGDVYTKETDDLILFNYSPAAQYRNRWNWFELNSRGLILEKKTGKIIARPFPKFFNWLEGGRKASGYIELITEKIDGSLGICYWYNDQWNIATRGSFNSEQALKGQELLELYCTEYLPKEYTYMLEIVYPENRIVVDYGNEEALYILGAIHTEIGKELGYYGALLPIIAEVNFRLPSIYDTGISIEKLLEWSSTLDANSEGWVIKFSDGSRWKIKGDAYLTLHKLITNLSKKRVFEALRDGNLDFFDRIPDEFMHDISNWKIEIQAKFDAIKSMAEDVFNESPGLLVTRKEFSEYANKKTEPFRNLLYLMYDERDITDAIWKYLEKNLDNK